MEEIPANGRHHEEVTPAPIMGQDRDDSPSLTDVDGLWLHFGYRGLQRIREFAHLRLSPDPSLDHDVVMTPSPDL